MTYPSSLRKQRVFGLVIDRVEITPRNTANIRTTNHGRCGGRDVGRGEGSCFNLRSVDVESGTVES